MNELSGMVGCQNSSISEIIGQDVATAPPPQPLQTLGYVGLFPFIKLATRCDMFELEAFYGLEYVLIQRARLGCQVDGGRYKIGSYTHADAEVVAAILAGMPDALGGKRMAIRVAELARAGKRIYPYPFTFTFLYILQWFSF